MSKREDKETRRKTEFYFCEVCEHIWKRRNSYIPDRCPRDRCRQPFSGRPIEIDFEKIKKISKDNSN